MLLYGITGACIVGIPLTFLLLFQCWRNAGLKQQINSYKELEKENLYMTVWVLKEDIAAGDKITRSDLEKEEKWIPKTCDIRQMALFFYFIKKCDCSQTDGRYKANCRP